jgi:DNA polymerase-3 subunit alpha (Gram-positive type)
MQMKKLCFWAIALLLLLSSCHSSDPSFVKVEDGKLRPPLNSLAGLGHAAAENLYKAASEGEFVSQEELKQRAGVSKSVIEIMTEYGCLGDMPETSQLTLF